MAALQRQRQRQIEPEGEIGPQTSGGDRLQLRDQGQRQPAAIPLISDRGTGEAITEHPVAGGQGGLNRGLHVLGPVGGVEQQLRRRAGGSSFRRMQQQPSQGLTQSRAARLPAHQQSRPGWQQAATGQPGPQSFELGGFATTIDALEHQEAPPRQRAGGGTGSRISGAQADGLR